MKYRNLRTGVEIETSGKINGGDWQEIPAKTPTAVETVNTPTKKTGPKNTKKVPTKTTARSIVKK